MGICVFILIPGMFVVHLLGDQRLVSIPFGMIIGFLLQLLSVFVIWCVNAIIGTVDFVFLLYMITFVFTTCAFLLSAKVNKDIKLKSFLHLDHFLVFVVILFVVVAFFYQFLFPSPHSDGAAYLDLARNVVEKNSFSSNFILPANNWAAVQWSTGLIDYFFGYSAIAVFFVLGNITLLSAKVMLIFAGALALFPLFTLTQKLFSRQVACVAVFVASFSPIMLTHVSLVGGPEIASLLFMLTTISLLLFSNDDSHISRLSILAGISLFAAWTAWLLTGYLLVMIIPFFFLLYSRKASGKSKWYAFAVLVILCGLFFLDFRIIGHVTYEYLFVPFPLTFFVSSLIVFKFSDRIKVPKFFVLCLATALCFLFITSYVPRLTSPSFINFYETSYPTAQENVVAHVVANVDIFNRIFDLTRFTNVSTSYIWGETFSWAGLLNSFGIVTMFLVILSFARIEKIKETLLIFSFTFFYMLMWIFVGPDWVIQPRYLLISAPFYFILVASTISLLVSTIDLTAMHKKIRARPIATRLTNHRLHLGKNHMKILVGALVVSSLIVFWQPIYTNGLNNGEYWNYEEKYGWHDALAWVKQNTLPNDVLLERQANFWAWLSDRKTVQVSNTMVEYKYGDIDKIDLINIIRQNRANYMIVDNAFYSSFPKLSDLYSSPAAFYGSPIVFQSRNNQGLETIIYNVTNMQNWENVLVVGEVNPVSIVSDNQTGFWTPFCLYSGSVGLPILSNGNSTQVQGLNSVSIEVGNGTYGLWGITHSFSSNQNWSSRNVLSFYWYGESTNREFRIDVHSPDSNNQYQKTFVDDFSGWKKITMPLNRFSIIGSPNWTEVSKLFLLCLSSNSYGTWHVGNFSLDSEYAEIVQPNGTIVLEIGST
jgi:hypothetical protein